MRNSVSFPVLSDLATIDFSNTSDVRGLVRERCQNMFGSQDLAYIDDFMKVTQDLFSGAYPGYQAVDTAYHDIKHTVQATLSRAELLETRHFSDAQPRIDAKDFKYALIAVLFHDTGYLKTINDTEGSGAKYTHLHEQRSCDFARAYLSQQQWSEDDIGSIENLISATGPSADVTCVGFGSAVERILGQTICTADYIGQMSEPEYTEKLADMFSEFKESYEYQQIPQSEWPFASFDDLLKSTPAFWNTFVRHKLEVECAGIERHLEHPVSGENPYKESVSHNMQRIEQRIAGMENQAG